MFLRTIDGLDKHIVDRTKYHVMHSHLSDVWPRLFDLIFPKHMNIIEFLWFL